METLIEVLGGVMLVIITASLVGFWPALGSLYVIDKACLWVTDGDVPLNPGPKVDNYLNGLNENITFPFCLVSFLMGVAFVIFIPAGIYEGHWTFHELVIMVYNAGVYCSPVLGNVLLVGGVMLLTKWIYKIGKKGSQLKKALDKHMEDPNAHNK